jgi:hypothetical protein
MERDYWASTIDEDDEYYGDPEYISKLVLENKIENYFPHWVIKDCGSYIEGETDLNNFDMEFFFNIIGVDNYMYYEN